MNRVTLIGHLTKPIELKYTQQGTAVGESAIAVNKKIKRKNGITKDETMFIDITFFSRAAEIANQYTSRGSQIAIEGRLLFQQWTAQDGSKRSKHSIVVDSFQLLGKKQEPSQENEKEIEEPQHQIPEIEIYDDEIPF